MIEVAKDAKLCPFCGGTEIVFEQYKHEAGLRWRIWCTQCLATIDPGWAQDKNVVLNRWNCRADKESEG